MAEINFPLNLRKFKIIYPLYINSNRTQQQGRKIGKDKAVSDPNVQEIEQALAKINGAKIIVELGKIHPREFNIDQPQFLGRVSVSLPPDYTEIKNKNQLLLYVANEISKMERKKFKVHQIVEQSDQSSSLKNQAANAKGQNQKKQTGNRKKNNRKK